MTSTDIKTPPDASSMPDVETASSAYARRFQGPIGSYFLQRQTEIVLRLLRPWPGASILDIGGGHGQLALPLVDHDFNVTVAGSMPSCRERLEELLPADSYSFECCSLTETPFPDNSFDVVVAVRLLTHLPNWQDGVREMCRIARHAVIFDYPDRRSINILTPLLFYAKRSVEGDTRRYRCFRAQDMLAALRAGGFGEAAIQKQFFFPMALHRSLRSATVSRVAEHAARMVGLTRLFGSPVIVRGLGKGRKEQIGWLPV